MKDKPLSELFEEGKLGKFVKLKLTQTSIPKKQRFFVIVFYGTFVHNHLSVNLIQRRHVCRTRLTKRPVDNYAVRDQVFFHRTLFLSFHLQAIAILEGLIPRKEDGSNVSASQLERLYIFCVMWSIGAVLELDDRAKMEEFTKQNFELNLPSIAEGSNDTIFEFLVNDAGGFLLIVLLSDLDAYKMVERGCCINEFISVMSAIFKMILSVKHRRVGALEQSRGGIHLSERS